MSIFFPSGRKKKSFVISHIIVECFLASGSGGKLNKSMENAAFCARRNKPLSYVYIVITICAIFVCFVFCAEMLVDFANASDHNSALGENGACFVTLLPYISSQ